MLRQHDFTGRVESTLEDRLGRRIEADLANLGRLLWFDNVHSLHRDNTCAGCHSPTNGFGDTQSIAIGVDNNGLVGPNRTGPRNQRRSPLIVNTAFYPKLMWNGRFFANAAPGKKLGDPFSNMFGFTFPAPEGGTLSYHDHLLQAQAFIPPTELVEVAGFTGTSDTDLSPRFEVFDNGKGLTVPHADESGFRNQPIRDKAIEILNATPGYRQAFGKVFPEVQARRADYVRHVRPRDCRVRVHADVRDRADRQVRARPAERDDRRRKARRARVLRRGQVHHVPRDEGQVERDVQRLRESRRRHSAAWRRCSASARAT